MKKTIPLLAVLFLFASAPLVAQQDSELAQFCTEVPAQASNLCYVVVQGVHSSQPQLGILIANGNPTLGTAGAGGLRLGAIPRVNTTFRLNASFVRVPDVFTEAAGDQVQRVLTAAGIPIPAISGDLSIGVFPGFDASPFIRGLGAIDLLGSATWLPFAGMGGDAFGDDNPSFGLGYGARLGLLRETAFAPAISLSVMRHSLGSSRFGDVCPGGLDDAADVCPGSGDAGEFAFDLATWSTRAMVSKRIFGLGATLGVGRDGSSSDVAFAFRDPAAPSGEPAQIHRGDGSISEGRTVVFGNLSYTILIGTLALEGGWVEGADPIQGFEATESDFDPTRRSYFAGLGLRIAF